MVQEIKSKYPNQKYIAYPDPANQRHTSALSTDHDILRKGGFEVRVKHKAPRIVDSVNAVNKAMDYTVIDPSCKEFIKDLEQVVLREGTREIDKSNKSLTHLTDAFRYSIDYEFPVKKPITRTYMA